MNARRTLWATYRYWIRWFRVGIIDRDLPDLTPTEIFQQLQILEEVSALQSTNIDRKLFIGNIRKDISASTVGCWLTKLTDMLNHALQKLNITSEVATVDADGNRFWLQSSLIKSSWISPNGKQPLIRRTVRHCGVHFAWRCRERSRFEPYFSVRHGSLDWL